MKTRTRSKNTIFILLFSSFLALNYLGLFSRAIPEFQESLIYRTTNGVPIYLTLTQFWVFNLISLLFDSLVITCSVGILGYYLRELRVFWGVLFGFLLIYYRVIESLLLVAARIIKGQTFAEANPFVLGINSGEWTLIILQILLTFSASYFSFNFAKKTTYFNSKDQELFYFSGISKKIWVLLIIACNPVAQFLSRLTISNSYAAMNIVAKNTFWKDTFLASDSLQQQNGAGMIGLLAYSGFIFFAWAISVALFSCGIKAMRDNRTNYRWLKISIVFILIPASIVFGAIFRNRTWFF
ncbi:MAG: hypothetical protein NTY45_09605 [Elusimicrobia bacterium]|nr:hypothetical protein [Elusimicrobiota bacterium]